MLTGFSSFWQRDQIYILRFHDFGHAANVQM